MVPALFDKYISAVMEKSSDKLASLFSVNLLYVNVIEINDGKITELIDYEDVLNREYIFQD